MKNFKIFFLSALVAVAGLFTACVEDTEIAPGPAVSEDCMEVYFVPAETPDYSFDIDADVSGVVVPVTVARTYFTDAITLPLIVQQDAQVFNVPEVVEFAAGQETATFNITINTPELGLQTVDISLGEDPAIVNPYSAAGTPFYGLSVDFYKWTKVCDAEVVADYFTYPRPTTLEHKEGTSSYRLTSLYVEGYDFYFDLSGDGYKIPEEYVLGTVTVGGVACKVFDTGMRSGAIQLWGAVDTDPKYSYFDEGEEMNISLVYLTSQMQIVGGSWFDVTIAFK